MILDLPALKPMLASSADPFDSHLFLFEPKWDGFRCLAYVADSATTLQSRNGVELTPRFPELAFLHRQVKAIPAILDGEIIAFHQGREVFHLLLQRMRKRPRATIGPRDVPALFVAFDILYTRGKSILHLPLQVRKELLNQEIIPNEYLVVNGYVHQSGQVFFEAAIAQGREGIMAKRLDSPYLPGKRTRLWLKIKPLKTIEAVVIGFIPKTDDTFASLALGQYSPEDTQLIYVGNVGTGFSENMMREILADLRPLLPPEELKVQRLPLSLPGLVLVRPEMVIEVSYLEYTPSGNLRHPTYRCRREDIEPGQCIYPSVDHL
jgi:DNA ligase D-like protein (predicted ligase)